MDIHMQKKEVRSLAHTIHKINSKWVKDLHVSTKTIKLLGENTGVYLCDFGLGSGSLDTIPKAWATKEKLDKLDSIKTKSLCFDTIKKVKRQSIEWENIFADHIFANPEKI